MRIGFTVNQLDTYHRLIDRVPDKFRLVLTTRDLDDVLSAWSHPDNEKVTHRLDWCH